MFIHQIFIFGNSSVLAKLSYNDHILYNIREIILLVLVQAAF